MSLQELLNKLPTLDYFARLRTISEFLALPSNRTDLSIEQLYLVIDKAVCTRPINSDHPDFNSLLRIFLACRETRELLIQESDGQHIKCLMHMDLADSLALCKGEYASHLLFNSRSASRKLFSYDEIKFLFVSLQKNESLYQDVDFSFYFENTSHLAKEIFFKVEDSAKINLLTSEVLTQSFSSRDFLECISDLPSQKIVLLLCDPSIYQRLEAEDLSKLIVKIPEDVFLISIASKSDFLELLPEFNFSDSMIMDKVCSFTSTSKVALFSLTNFMLKMTAGCIRRFVESLSSSDQLQLLRQREIFNLLRESKEDCRAVDEIVLNLLNKEEISQQLTAEEIISIIENLHTDYLPLMSFLSSDYFLSFLDEPDELVAVAEIIAEKFSCEQIFLFIKSKEFTRLFYEEFEPKSLSVFFRKYPQLALSILCVPYFIENNLGIELYYKIIGDLGDKFDEVTFFKKAISSADYRRVIEDDDQAPRALQIKNFILNSSLNEVGIISIFKTDPKFIGKCDLDKWYEYFLEFYKDNETPEVMALYLLGEVLLNSQEGKSSRSKVDSLKGLKELSLPLLAKLLLSESDAIPSLIIANNQIIENFNENLIPLIVEEAKHHKNHEGQILIERLLRLDVFVNDFQSSFQRSLLYVKSVGVSKATSLIIDFCKKNQINSLQWKQLINELMKEDRIDVLKNIFFHASIVNLMGEEALIYAMNQGVLDIDHLASFERDGVMQTMLTSDVVQEKLRFPENEKAKKVAYKIPEFQKKSLKDRVFEDSWNDRAIKGPLVFFGSQDYVPTHIKKMREAFARKETLESIKEIARSAAKNKRFWLWNTRRSEVQSFYEEVALIEQPISEERISKAKELVSSPSL